MKRILIYGTGKNAVRETERCNSLGDSLIGFCETEKKKDIFLGYKVYNADEVIDIDFDEIHIANTHIETLEKCINLGINRSKIVLVLPEVKGDHNIFLEYLKRNKYLFDIKFIGGVCVTRIMLFRSLPLNTERMEFGGNQIFFNDDYVRHGTLMLLRDEIKKNGIVGDIAELGVYQGKFSAMLNKLFPERTLHLFDTFKGFSDEDITDEERERVGAKAGQFGETSLEAVLRKMNDIGKIEVHVGWFPDTVPENNIEYSFVSIDCDLYSPAKAGLEYFYPRLSVGGYIMLHDYNGFFENGIQKAVLEFEKEHGRLCKVPIPDEAGSVIVAK